MLNRLAPIVLLSTLCLTACGPGNRPGAMTEDAALSPEETFAAATRTIEEDWPIAHEMSKVPPLDDPSDPGRAPPGYNESVEADEVLTPDEFPEYAPEPLPAPAADFSALRQQCESTNGGNCCLASVIFMETGNFPLAQEGRSLSASPPQSAVEEPTDSLQETAATDEGQNTEGPAPKQTRAEIQQAAVTKRPAPICPPSQMVNSLNCATSYQWCEPATISSAIN